MSFFWPLYCLSFFWPLYCLSFFDLQLLINPLVSSTILNDSFYYISAWHVEGKILECDASIQKLIQLLETDTFVSGAHIDYFDL